MEWFEAVILGLVQGLTEFLPVSSSGHLVIGKDILGVEHSDDLVFEVTVHAATVLSTIVVFRKQIWKLIRGFFGFKDSDEMDYVLKIFVSMIPVFVVGVFFKDFVEGLFGSVKGVATALVATAVLLTFSDNFKGSDKIREKGYRKFPNWFAESLLLMFLYDQCSGIFSHIHSVQLNSNHSALNLQWYNAHKFLYNHSSVHSPHQEA